MKQDASAEETLKRWQDEEAAVRARIIGRGVATRDQLVGLNGLQQMQLLLDGKAPAPPISETLDFALVEVAHGRAIFQGKPSPRLLNPMGTVHGGWYATLLDSAERQMRLRAGSRGPLGLPLLRLERLTFRFVQAGFVLLSATLLAGLLFTEQLYGAGRVWKWDHKTVFSVLSWLAFLVLLLGRARFGWRGRNAVRILYAGSALLMLAYVGSRFVLEVILGRST